MVTVSSLEAAELVKLINNSFRDLSFSFANGVSLFCDYFNINANHLINAANEGYPRNTIPLPSPGVGGYCLTKDPFLYAATKPDSHTSTLSRTARAINDAASYYPVSKYLDYCSRISQKPSNHKALIIGIAFKGLPE